MVSDRSKQVTQKLKKEDYINLLKPLKKYKKSRIVLMTTSAKKIYHKFKFKKNDMLLFGRESSGVPQKVHKIMKYRIKILFILKLMFLLKLHLTAV